MVCWLSSCPLSLSLSYVVLLSVSGFVSTQPQFLFFLGLPSHAFSRNYYCRFCSFNTTKSKVHLYHLVDVHGVDYKIFSCDRCDYASRWKCKVCFVYILYTYRLRNSNGYRYLVASAQMCIRTRWPS